MTLILSFHPSLYQKTPSLDYLTNSLKQQPNLGRIHLLRDLHRFTTIIAGFLTCYVKIPEDVSITFLIYREKMKFTLRNVLWHGRTMVIRWGRSALSSAWRVWKSGRCGRGGKWDLWTCSMGCRWMGRGCGAPPGCFTEETGATEAERKRQKQDLDLCKCA